MAIPATGSPGPSDYARRPHYVLGRTLQGHTRGVSSVKFSPDGHWLATAGADGIVHLWDAYTGEHRRSLRGHIKGVNDIAISPDSLYIATASDDSNIFIYPLCSTVQVGRSATDTDTPADTGVTEYLRKLDSHTAPVLCLAFSPKSNLLVSGSFDESAIVWDVRRGKPLRVLPAHADPIWTVGFSAEGGMVVTGSADGLMRLWDTSTGQCLKTIENETNSPVSFASFTPSSSFILSSTLSSTIRLYNFHTSKVLKTLRAPDDYISERFCSPAVMAKALQPKDAVEPPKADRGPGRRRIANVWIVAGSENGKVVIWDLQTREILQVLSAHTAPVLAVAVHPSSRIVATGSLDPERLVNIWYDTD